MEQSNILKILLYLLDRAPLHPIPKSKKAISLN